MNVQLKVLIVLILPVVKCETLNNDLEDNTNRQKNQFDDDRFNKDLEDEEWHVAHLRQGRRHCAGDTFEDRARRYRKSLQNDPALVKFVSSDPIPFNISDIVEDETCKVDLKDPQISHKHKEATTLSKTEVKAAFNNTQNSSAAQKASDATSTVGRTDNYQATTPTMRVTDDRSKEEGVEKEENSKSRRGSEYMFSSIEYYDETPDFDVSICPDAVDVIVLEIDEIRSYDVECERIVEWRSLID